MSEEWYCAYELERDREYIERLQAATVQGSGFALDTSRGLIGTPKWWDAVSDGTIPTTSVHGTILDIRVNSDNWPEFEISDGDGVSVWALEGDIKSYRVGGGVRIDFVTVRYAKPPDEGEDAAKVVLGIWVEV
jgi:hypothetical protein